MKSTRPGLLLTLRVKDLAIIDSAELELEPGFTALTGETGAGKSILVDALTLVLGARASADLIRSGAEFAEVEARFDVSAARPALDYLTEAGYIGEDPAEAEGELLIRRQLARSGKSRAWINGRLAGVGALAELARRLVDVYGQHEYQGLLRPERRRALLDAFGGHATDLAAYREAHLEWKTLSERLASLDLDERARREREDLLRYRVKELEAAELVPGEDEALGREREILRNAEVLIGAAREGAEQLYQSDRAVVSGLEALARRLRDAAAKDPWFNGPAEQVESAAALGAEAARDLAGRAEAIEADPERLLAVEDRIHELNRLKRKYGGGIPEALAALAEARAELGLIERRDQTLAELTQQVETARARLDQLAEILRGARRRAGQELSERMVGELAELGMAKAVFEVRLEPLAGGPAAHGGDEVLFLISTNPGEPPRPLEKIASGGELSRIMLALRGLLSDEGDAPCIVFDEVDAGVGGAVAEMVGLRMRRIARDRQVLCVTHQARIAALADHQARVEKPERGGRVRVEVKTLSPDARIEELARMLGGLEITDAVRAHAREMLALKEEKKDRPAARGRGRPAK